MTDKQIKDGIDVSQCECYSVEDNSCNDTLSGSCMKEKCQTFRLLQTIKAKEQECEKKSWEIGNLGYKIKNQRKEINIRLEQLDQLKAENEELKNTIDDLLHKPKIQDKILWKIDNEALLGSKDAYIYKLEKTIAEIKEIAERCGKRIPLFEIDEIAEDLQQILQKISECEGNNEH